MENSAFLGHPVVKSIVRFASDVTAAMLAKIYSFERYTNNMPRNDEMTLMHPLRKSLLNNGVSEFRSTPRMFFLNYNNGTTSVI